MDHARLKALELAISVIQGHESTLESTLELAEAFRAYIDPPEPIAADGDNYPRIQVP